MAFFKDKSPYVPAPISDRYTKWEMRNWLMQQAKKEGRPKEAERWRKQRDRLKLPTNFSSWNELGKALEEQH